MEIIWLIVIIAFFLQFLDSAAGMGFGTSITPVLFLLGYHPLEIVPALLVVQIITGFVSSFFHHEFKNVQFSFSPLNDCSRIMLFLAAIGCVSTFISIFLTYFAFKLPENIIKGYVSALIILMGVVGIFRGKRKKEFNPKKLAGFAALAGFNKGIGAGGYGPVLTLGQIFSGIYEKSAVGIVSLSESIVSMAGVFSFLVLGGAFELALVPSLFTGSFFAAILAPYVVRIIPNNTWKYVIPSYAFGVGIMGILNLFFF